MSQPKKPTYRRRRLFPRTLDEVVQQATKPLMDKQGKLMGALLRDWEKIVGEERALVTRPQRLQFTAAEGTSATLHLAVRPAVAPELTYALEQMIEQCARYFGYRAITRVILHPTHDWETKDLPPVESPIKAAPPLPSLPSEVPSEMRDVLARISGHIASTVVKKN